jgi:hypothetical protein
MAEVFSGIALTNGHPASIRTAVALLPRLAKIIAAGEQEQGDSRLNG